MTRVVLLEVEINRHKEILKIAVMDLNSMDMFLWYDWLVKHNLEVNWKDSKIQFTRCSGFCRIKYQDIEFRTRRTQITKTPDKNKSDIGKEPDLMNLQDLLEYIWSFMHLFNRKKFEKLPERREWDYKINLIEEAPRELNVKAYVMTIKEKEVLNQWLDEQLKARLIVESKSRYTALCFYIPKKDGSLCLVQDYQKLNQVTIKDKIPLSLIEEVINKLKKAKYFNKLDFIWGYNNVQIKKGDKWKVTFVTNKGSFKPQVMYFGLCNLLGIFQQMMNSIFWELLHKGVLANYIDDFVILVKTMKELEERIIWFLKITEKCNLYFKRSKYNFNMEEIPILGVVIGKG